MIECSNKKLCDFSETDLLTLSAVITKEISKVVKDIDVLNMVSNLASSIGANLTLVADQRETCAKTIRTNTTS